MDPRWPGWRRRAGRWARNLAGGLLLRHAGRVHKRPGGGRARWPPTPGGPAPSPIVGNAAPSSPVPNRVVAETGTRPARGCWRAGMLRTPAAWARLAGQVAAGGGVGRARPAAPGRAQFPWARKKVLPGAINCRPCCASARRWMACSQRTRPPVPRPWGRRWRRPCWRGASLPPRCRWRGSACWPPPWRQPRYWPLAPHAHLASLRATLLWRQCHLRQRWARRWPQVADEEGLAVAELPTSGGRPAARPSCAPRLPGRALALPAVAAPAGPLALTGRKSRSINGGIARLACSWCVVHPSSFVACPLRC